MRDVYEVWDHIIYIINLHCFRRLRLGRCHGFSLSGSTLHFSQLFCSGFAFPALYQCCCRSCLSLHLSACRWCLQFATVSKIEHFRSLHWGPSWPSCINAYMTIDSGGNESNLVVARNCCMARMLPGEAELVSERTGLPGGARSVKRFERSNGLDTALYKNYLLYFNDLQQWVSVMRWTNSATQEFREVTLVYLYFHFVFTRKSKPACQLFVSLRVVQQVATLQCGETFYILLTSPNPITSHSVVLFVFFFQFSHVRIF